MHVSGLEADAAAAEGENAAKLEAVLDMLDVEFGHSGDSFIIPCGDELV